VSWVPADLRANTAKPRPKTGALDVGILTVGIARLMIAPVHRAQRLLILISESRIPVQHLQLVFTICRVLAHP
jgi:hypothetical protein